MSRSIISRCFVLCTVVAVGICGSCSGLSGVPERNDAGIEPTAARDAIVALIRQDPTIFIGNPDPDRLADLDLEPRGKGVWQFGAFEFDVRKMTYSAMIGEDGPEPYLYEGKLTTHNRIVIAEHPRLTRFHRAPE